MNSTHPQLRDYHGSTSQINTIALILIAIFLIGLVISYFLWLYYGWLKFNQICTSSKLSGEEVGALRSWVRLFKVKRPIDLFTHLPKFDEFVSKIAHECEFRSMSEEEGRSLSTVFSSIRGKLNFGHAFQAGKVLSSRALPVDYKVNISFKDQSGVAVSFASQVVASEELFLTIAPPPSRDIEKQILSIKKAAIEINFTRNKDAEYNFLSNMIYIEEKTRYWRVRHSDRLMSNPLPPTVHIPGTILYTVDEGSDKTLEERVTIKLLYNQGCTFLAQLVPHPLPDDSQVVINFKVEGRLLSCQGMITHSKSWKGSLVYTMVFEHVPEETKALLLKSLIRTSPQ